ncbi:hypothetical protein ACI2LF_34565 [Kribbella sp. NPDC020789]
MNLTRKNSLIVVATCAVLATLAQLFSLPGWIPVSLLIVILLAVVTALRDSQPPPPEPPVPADPPPVLVIDPESQPTSSQVVYDVMLESAAAEYQFSFSATVYWKPVGLVSSTADLASSAIQAVVTRAKRELATVEPTQQELAQHRLSAVLSRRERDDRNGVIAWAERIQVRLPEPFAELARTRSERRRRREIIELEQAVERNVRTYLKDEAFATPGSATIWWLARHPEELERCLELYPTLRQLSNAANDRAETLDDLPQPTAAAPLPASATQTEPPTFDLWAAVENFLDGHDPDERTLKASHLAKLEDKFKRFDRARVIREQFSPNSLPGLLTDAPDQTRESASTPDDEEVIDSVDGSRNPAQPSSSAPSTPDSTSATSVPPPAVSAAQHTPPATARPADPAVPAAHPPAGDSSQGGGSGNGSVAFEEPPYREEFYSAPNGALAQPAPNGTTLPNELSADADGSATKE